MSLDAVRKEINEIDDSLLDLLDRRLSCSAEVARVKMASGDDIYKPKREKEICDKFSKDGNPWTCSTIKNIMRNSRKYQYGLFLAEGKENEEFAASLSEEQKVVFQKGGELCLTFNVDETSEQGLNSNDIISIVADSMLKIQEIAINENKVTIKMHVENQEMAKKEAYLISYLLYVETMK